ncbi:hypothetical protein AGR4A_pAt10459 [Agrobacterium tumefaciens str. B6]|uniref:Uncharacterized protein n=1 Tax=Agrobacterium tumefaciens str. B6 TaxID=1183423 RepID=A0A822VD45_AGRTU|nr:hypothetical protein AGR4A_pAt10459 [Agrobacterium tumefaciens str. B6]
MDEEDAPSGGWPNSFKTNGHVLISKDAFCGALAGHSEGTLQLKPRVMILAQPGRRHRASL